MLTMGNHSIHQTTLCMYVLSLNPHFTHTHPKPYQKKKTQVNFEGEKNTSYTLTIFSILAISSGLVM